MRRFVSFGPALVVLLTTIVTLAAAPAAIRLVRAADAAARAQAARDALAADDILQRLSRATANVADAVLPSVVHIDVRTADNDSSLGSGWVYDPQGYIVTNAHVVANAATINVQFNDGRIYSADVAGADAGTDVAVLKIDPLETLLPLPRSHDPLDIGQRVYSFGSPFNFKFSMSEGIVSGLGRESTSFTIVGGFSNFIQFDAAVNPGNSGGPVVDVLGRVIGMNVAIANNTNSLGTSDQGQSAGISFAIPVRVAEFVAGQLIQHGQVRRGFLGINLPGRDGPQYLRDRLNYVGLGVHVPGIVEGGPADQAGLRVDDIIIAIDDQRITGVEMMRSIISTMAPGQQAAVQVWRAGNTLDLTVTVAEFEQPALVRQNVTVTLNAVGIAFGRAAPPNALPTFEFVVPGSPAARAGLSSGATVIAVNNRPVNTIQELCNELDRAQFRLGTPVRLTVDLAPDDQGQRRRREITLRVPR